MKYFSFRGIYHKNFVVVQCDEITCDPDFEVSHRVQLNLFEIQLLHHIKIESITCLIANGKTVTLHCSIVNINMNCKIVHWDKESIDKMR